MGVTETIKEKLLVLGVEYDALKPFMQDYLQKVEAIITERENARTGALEQFRTASFSVTDIAKEVGCSRTTLYNHEQLLKRYIELSKVQFDQNNPYAAIDSRKEELSRMREQISLMESRDIDFELLRHENALLVRKDKEQAQEIDRLRTRVHELSGELHELKKEVPHGPAKITKL